MSNVNRGRELELAVKRAAVEYRKESRACLVQQFPRTATGPGGTLVYAGSAPADFLGAIGNVASAVECKECAAKSFPLANIDTEQRAALDAFEAYGFDVFLVIDMAAYGEVYILPYFTVAAFIAAPYRKSLTIDYLRAFGQLVPMEGEDKKRRALFLDAVAHPEADRALLSFWDDRKDKPLVSLDGPDDTDEEPTERKPSPYAGLTKDQIKERLRAAVEEGLVNQLKEQSKKRTWGTKRGRKTE